MSEANEIDNAIAILEDRIGDLDKKISKKTELLQRLRACLQRTTEQKQENEKQTRRIAELREEIKKELLVQPQ